MTAVVVVVVEVVVKGQWWKSRQKQPDREMGTRGGGVGGREGLEVNMQSSAVPPYPSSLGGVNQPFFSWICTRDLNDCCALAKLY